MSRHQDIIRYAHQAGYRVSEDGTLVAPSGRVLKAYVQRHQGAHLRKNIRIPGSPYASNNFDVHRLAAFQWFGEASFAPGNHVRHLDGNAQNNSRANLALGTATDNAQDKPPALRRRVALQAASARRRLIPELARSVVARAASGESGSRIARDLSIPKSTVSEILSGKLYSDVTGLTFVERSTIRRAA